MNLVQIKDLQFYVPSLPGCISEGNTREEALKNIKEAVELYLEPTEDDHIDGESGEVLEFRLVTVVPELPYWEIIHALQKRRMGGC